MADYADLFEIVRGAMPQKPLPAIWDFLPSHSAAVGGICDFNKYYFDVEYKLNIQCKLKALLPKAVILPGIFPDLGVILEASAFGGKILWFKDNAPFIEHAIHDRVQIDHIKAPKIETSGLLPLALVQQRVMHRRLKQKGSELDQWAHSMGPAEIAGLIMGYDNLYMAMYDDPKRLLRLMEITTELVVGWIQKLGSFFGPDGAQVIAVNEHVPHQVSPAHFDAYIFPYLKAIFESFPKAVKIYHNEGYHSDGHVKRVLKLGADIWHFGSDVHAIPDLLTKVGDQIILLGGLNPHGVIRTGTPEMVRKEVRATVSAAKGHRFILSTGTGTTPDTTLANQRAMVDACVN